MNRDALLKCPENITQAATDAIADVLPGMLDAAMPELPNVTGGAVPVGEGKGGSVPGMRLP